MTLTLTGCWNYREVDRLAIVAGMAVDKGEKFKYKVTLELIQISQERDAKPKSRVITSEGNTVFDAVRNAISIAGKKLYWSHGKVIILSQEIAKEGVVKILDWYTRDAETRSDVNLLISAEKTAGEIFTETEESSDIKSVTLHEIFKNQQNLNKAPDIQIWRFLNMLAAPGVSPIAATVKLKNENGKIIPELSGTAIFSKDKFIGFMDGEETQDLLLILGKVKGGILVQNEQAPEGDVVVSLEIFGSKTKIEPEIGADNSVTMHIRTKTDVAIDEIEGSENYIEDTMREKLQQDVENALKADLEENIKYVQSEFGVDIFGFGNKVYQDYPQVWKSIADQWPGIFKELPVDIECDIHIRNGAMRFKTITVGD